MKLIDYNDKYIIVSLALDEETKKDLEKDNVKCVFIDNDKLILCPGEEELNISPEDLKELKQYSNYDVFDIWEDGTLYLRYDTKSVDNLFFITGKCNSSCVMCPSSDYSRMHGDIVSVDSLIEVASHIPTSAKHLTITGGEPFLAGEKLFDFLSFLRDKFEATEFLILTNGRVFALNKYAELLSSCIPEKTIIAIPVHGSKAEIHDAITQADGSFKQTLKGIKRLIAEGISVELRIVVSKLNEDDLTDLCDLIANELHDIEYVSIIAMEMTGSAFVNRDKVWIPYREAFSKIEEGVLRLINSGITVKLYNFPLCTVPAKYHMLCEKSISPEKVRYGENCDSCRMKKGCGGVFSGTYMLVKDELTPLL